MDNGFLPALLIWPSGILADQLQLLIASLRFDKFLLFLNGQYHNRFSAIISNKFAYNETWKWLVIKLCVWKNKQYLYRSYRLLNLQNLNHFHTDLRGVPSLLGFNHEVVGVFQLFWFVPSFFHCKVWGKYSLWFIVSELKVVWGSIFVFMFPSFWTFLWISH